MRFFGHQKQTPPSHRFDVRHLGALPSLATNRLLGFAASNLIWIFFPIFLYEFFGLSLSKVLLWFLISRLIRLPLFVWAARIFSRIGLIPSMVVGTAGWVVFYVTSFSLATRPDFHPWLMLGIIVVSLGVFNCFYWAPFHVDFAEFSTKGKRGRQIGIFYAAQQLIGIGAPMLGGVLIASYGYGAAFLVGIVVILLSLIPLAFLPRVRVRYEFGFFETFRRLFSSDYRDMTWSMVALGAEGEVGFVIWPIFLFLVFGGEHLDVGLFAGLIVIVGVLLQLFIGRRLDDRPPHRLLKWGVDLYALGWIGKAAVDTVTGVFAASAFHSFGSIVMRTPLDLMMYERAADCGHYVDEFTVMREIALTIGRVGIMALLIAVTAYFSISASFIVAALLSFGAQLFARWHVPARKC